MPRYRLLLVGLLLCLSGAGGWYLFGSAPEYPAAEPRLSVGQALGGEVAGFARADRQREFRFPDDHGPHPAYRTEWWYYTGNLQSAAGRHFGFQLTFFRTALNAPRGQPERASAWGTRDVSMAHFAVSDVAAGQFHVFQRFQSCGARSGGCVGPALSRLARRLVCGRGYGSALVHAALG